MKFLQAIFLTAALTGCGNQAETGNTRDSIVAHDLVRATSTSQTEDSLAGRWSLIPALPSDTATGRIPYLVFNLTNMKVTGNTGCNNFSGSFAKDNSSLSFDSNFVSTKMACPGYDESAFIRNLLRTNRYKIYGDTLELQTDRTPLSYWLKTNR